MTAARHFDQFAAVPGHDEIVAMAPAAIYSCLANDDDTAVAIGSELASMAATPQEVAVTFAVLASAMLGEACGGRSQARRLAAQWAQKIASREARVVADRNAASATGTPSLPLAEPAKPISLRDELRNMGLL